MSFAQHNDEQIIDGFFGSGFVGRFLDIGAFDGESMSNTRALALRGWHGVLVEPAPAEFLKLYERYKDNERMTLINAAVSGHSGLCNLWPDTTEYRYGSTLDRAWAEFSHIKGSKPYKVNAVGIREICALGAFDFVTIDTEGEDYDILFHGDWSEARLLCVETTAKPEAPWKEALAKHGFEAFATTPTNTYAQRILLP